MFYKLIIIFLACSGCVFASTQNELDNTWVEYAISYGEDQILMKLPTLPEIWDTDEGRRWMKCEADHVVILALFQANNCLCTNTRLIRKYIKETPPFDGYACMELLMLQTKNTVTSEETWKAPKAEQPQKWDIVKERRIFTPKGIYTFFVAFESEENHPPYSYFFSTIKFLK